MVMHRREGRYVMLEDVFRGNGPGFIVFIPLVVPPGVGGDYGRHTSKRCR
jgi:hypothetical protein